jgi:hypothetical protein
MSNAKFLQIAPYALLEYEYNSKTVSSNDLNFLRVDDSASGRTIVLNENKGVAVTNNVMDRSAIRLQNNRWVHMDIDRAVPYITSSTTHTVTELSEVGIPWNVKYDKVRLHILSGYNLEDIEGLILDVKFEEANSVFTTVASQAYLKGDSHIEFNPRPIILGERLYDRYIEFWVPSLSFLNTEFANNPATPTGELAYHLSSRYKGFVQNSTIRFVLHEIDIAKTENAQLYLWTSREFPVSVNQEDQYALFTCVVQESEDGDYFEYYPSWDGGFIEDYLNNLVSVGGDYYVIHNLDVYEQVGFEEVRTASFVQFQDTNFDKPALFRPIILNAESAFAFSIEYTCRLINKNDASQIIRISSVTSHEPKKYGRQFEKITLRNESNSFKVYNKVVEGAQFNMPPVATANKVETVFVPTFFSMNDVGTTVTILRTDEDGNVLNDAFLDAGIIYGQGDAIILISPFDNYIKFKLYQTEGRTKAPVPRDLSNGMDLYLVFLDDSGIKRRYRRIKNSEQIKANLGEVVFRIPSSEAQRIVNYMDKNFYITAQASGTEAVSDEMVLYTGQWAGADQIDEVREQIDKIKEDALLKRARELRELQAQLDSRNAELAARAAALEEQAAQQNALTQQLSVTQSRLTLQESNLDERSRFLAEQGTLLRDRDAEYRNLIKSSQEQHNSSLAALQALVSKLQSQADTEAVRDYVANNPGIPLNDPKVDYAQGYAGNLFGPGSGTFNPVININLPDIPGQYGNDLGLNDRRVLPVSQQGDASVNPDLFKRLKSDSKLPRANFRGQGSAGVDKDTDIDIGDHNVYRGSTNSSQ